MAKKYEQKDMTGTLWLNDKKTTEKHPDLTGNIMINHVKYRLAAWKKAGEKGTFLSLAVSEFLEKEQAKVETDSLGF